MDGLAQRFRARAFDLYDPTFLNLLCKTIGVLEYEILLMISLDARRAYICDEAVSIGDRDRIDGRYRFLVQRALVSGAASLLLVHNHPSGSPQPSHGDIRFTRAFNALARAIEIELADHLVVTRSAVHSIMLGRPV